MIACMTVHNLRINQFNKHGETPMIEITQEMIDFCRDLGTGKRKPQFIHSGLCGNFFEEFWFTDTKLSHTLDFTEYPNFSGNILYPIKSPIQQYDSEDIYDDWDIEKWDARTKYGKERRRFCLWCADELERKMSKQQ